MVKFKRLVFCLLAFLLCIFAAGCSLDFLGFFVSSDLDERLMYRDKSDFTWNTSRLPLSLTGDYSFIIVADTHFEKDKNFGLDSVKMQSAIDANPGAQFVVFLGDITQSGYKKEIDSFLDIADGVTVPVFPVIGNHDVYFGNWSLWRDNIGSTCYRYDSGDTTLIILDTANSYYGKEQLDWLERQMKDAKENVFVFSHAPLFIPSNKLILPPDFQQVTYTNERARILSILKDKGTAMFMGHLHLYYTNKAGNADYVSVESYYDDKSYLLVTVTGGKTAYKTKKF